MAETASECRRRSPDGAGTKMTTVHPSLSKTHTVIFFGMKDGIKFLFHLRSSTSSALWGEKLYIKLALDNRRQEYLEYD